MKKRAGVCVAVGAGLLTVAVGLTIGLAHLYGGAGEDEWVPDLTGVWTTRAAGYLVQDVTDADCLPVNIERSLDRDLVVSGQTGRVFAGAFDGGKLTGLMLPDRTIHIQYYQPSGERIFITGRLARSGRGLGIEGCLHFYGEPVLGFDKKLAAAFIRLQKTD